MTLHIRRRVAADDPALSRIWLDASRAAHGFIGEARLLAQQKLIETVYLPEAETWVAEAGRPVGFIGLLDDFVGGLFVAPAYQGQGLGAALLDHAKGRRDRLELEVYTANEGAMRFYLREGFAERSRRGEDDEGLPHENARMVWER